MQIIDDQHIEIECCCGARSNHPIAEGYGRRHVICPRCGRWNNLNPEENQLLRELVAIAAAELRERFRIGESEE
jgi:hypothetical protein